MSQCKDQLNSCESLRSFLVMLFLQDFNFINYFLQFILYILLLLCFIFILMQNFIFTFKMMTEVGSKLRVLLQLVFTSNCF